MWILRAQLQDPDPQNKDPLESTGTWLTGLRDEFSRVEKNVFVGK